MTLEELFTVALGLGRQWRVAQCRFEGEPKRLELRLEHVPGEHFECPVCKDLCGIHDTIERRWRHMDFFQYRCELVARVPRNVLDAENSRLLLMVEGRSAEALKTFATALLEHGGDPSQIEAIAMDMSPAYVKGATEYFPGARIVFDKFHLMVLAGAALDQVRYELQREGADLKGACGACAATSGTSVRIVKSNAKISVVSTPNLAVR
jgi:transposase